MTDLSSMGQRAGGGALATRRAWPLVAQHIALNVAFPVFTAVVASVIAGRKELVSFACFVVAPWTALATALIVGRWWLHVRRGKLPASPTLRQLYPGVLDATVMLALASLIVGSVSRGALWLPAALDGGVSALIAGSMSALALRRRRVSSPSKESP